jgi:hypothetical protein
VALVDRAKNMILKPKEEWAVVAAEPADAASLYTGYIMPLAAITPICSFVGMSIIGITVPFIGTVKTPMISGIIQAAISYVVALVAVYIVAMIAATLAPNFGGVKDQVQGLKLCAYASTPAWIAGIFTLYSPLGIVTLIAALYGLYVLYLGVPDTMKVPKDKAIGFIAVLILVEIVVFILVGIVAGVARGIAGGVPGIH